MLKGFSFVKVFQWEVSANMVHKDCYSILENGISIFKLISINHKDKEKSDREDPSVIFTVFDDVFDSVV